MRLSIVLNLLDEQLYKQEHSKTWRQQFWRCGTSRFDCKRIRLKMLYIGTTVKLNPRSKEMYKKLRGYEAAIQTCVRQSPIDYSLEYIDFTKMSGIQKVLPQNPRGPYVLVEGTWDIQCSECFFLTHSIFGNWPISKKIIKERHFMLTATTTLFGHGCGILVK